MAQTDTISELIVLRSTGAHAQRMKARPSPGVTARGARESIGDLLKRRPGRLLERKELLEVVKDAGLELKHHLTPGQSMTLSPRTNYVEGHGYLNFINVSHVYGENNQAWFSGGDDHQPDEARKLEIWMTGLTVGASYMVQLRVSGYAEGSWEVRGSDTTGVTTVAGGYNVTIPVLVYQVDMTLSLVTIHATKMWSWGFYDATITGL